MPSPSQAGPVRKICSLRWRDSANRSCSGMSTPALREPELTDRRSARIRRHQPSGGATVVVAILIFIAYALAITWPLAIHPGSTIFGMVGSDLTGGITRIRELAEAHQLPFLPGTIH